MGKKGEKWGISQSVYPIPHKINSPFFPIFPHFSPLVPPRPDADFNFLWSLFIWGIQESLLSIITPKIFVSWTSGIIVPLICRV